MTDRWMHPAIWLLLFFAAPPIWLLLIVLRHLDEIVMTAGIICAVIICAWFLASVAQSVAG